MPEWFVTCPKCAHAFTFTKIAPQIVRQSLLDPFGVIARPAIADQGEVRTCPKCTAQTTFRRLDLLYRHQPEKNR